MLIKRPMYNAQMECVAIEIIADEQAGKHFDLFEHFATLLRNTEQNLPLFVPYALKLLVEKADSPTAHSFVLKLHAADIDKECPRQELETSPYQIALLIDTPSQLAWLNFADYIALSEQLILVANVSNVVKYSQARHHKVIAYDLSHQDHFERCKRMAMDYFCGDFIFHPADRENQDVAANQLNLMELISRLQQPDTDLDSVVELIQNDPMLSYQLLKVVNSAAFSGYQAIESIQQAVMRLGVLNLKNWVTVLSMTKVSNKPIEIIESGLIRAYMAKKLAETQPELCAQSAYTAGLLSVLDSLMDTPMARLIEKITLADEIKIALLSHKGALGELLATVIRYEEGHLNNQEEVTYFGIDLEKVYIDCIEQVAQSKKAMNEMS
ncbi:EAL and HDOD domain-containing protein [Legionella fairfieldensis]|uniref:EAL and HDOD domain-containing protein n=1 Tax=Legionella fairfieldensis TaxID=45064 RepID=UPI00048F662B|nr:HDOD domain-containing protein [Legionella fairfieldensis]